MLHALRWFRLSRAALYLRNASKSGRLRTDTLVFDFFKRYPLSKDKTQHFGQRRSSLTKCRQSRVRHELFGITSARPGVFRPTCPMILTVEPTFTLSVASSSHTPGSTCTFRTKTWKTLQNIVNQTPTPDYHLSDFSPPTYWNRESCVSRLILLVEQIPKICSASEKVHILPRTFRKRVTISAGRRCLASLDQRTRLMTLYNDGNRGSGSVIRAAEVAHKCL